MDGSVETSDIENGTSDLDGLDVRHRKGLHRTRFFDRVQHFVEMVTKEGGNDAWWCFRGTETVFIGGRGNTGTEETTVLVDGMENRDKEDKKAIVGFRSNGKDQGDFRRHRWRATSCSACQSH